MKSLILCLILSNVAFAYESPSPSSSPSPSPSVLRASCKIKIMCPNGTELSCKGEGNAPSCKEGEENGKKWISCDDDVNVKPDGEKQFCK